MKPTLRALALAAVILSPSAALAVDEHHPADGKKSAAPAKPSGTPPSAGSPDSRAAMQQRMQTMQQQMDRIHKTTDPKERQKLLDEHYRTMMENMKAMRGSGGPMSMGMKMHGDAKGAPHKGADPADRAAHMEQRMEMMHMMMEHMMQREQLRGPAK